MGGGGFENVRHDANELFYYIFFFFFSSRNIRCLPPVVFIPQSSIYLINDRMRKDVSYTILY